MSDEQLPINPANSGEAAARARAVEEFTAKEIAEKDDRPFFFRHVTPIVHTCAVLLMAGMWACSAYLMQRREEIDVSRPGIALVRRYS